MKTNVKLLFIGNSHTYFNDMPEMVKTFAQADGFACEVTMLSHGGWFLSQHAEGEEARFNILFGGYDYVMLQEHTHPFAPEEKYFPALDKLNGWIREAGAKAVIYATWARTDEAEKQPGMNELQRAGAERIGALLAPVGENWFDYAKTCPDTLYAQDGGHASPAGSTFAAKTIWTVIKNDLHQ